jgi:putative oxidoreductase
MNSIQRIERWGEAHHPLYMDIVRIALGVFLCLKGIEFASKTYLLSEILSHQVSFNGFLLIIVQHYIIFAHVAGGFMIAIGLLTRVAAIAQIPILLGALIFVNWSMMAHFSGFIIALIVLILLAWFAVTGSGAWSLDRALDREELH